MPIIILPIFLACHTGFVPSKVYPSLVTEGYCETCELKIPKTIHQIWHAFKPGAVPSTFSIALNDEIKQNHPDWKYVFWDESSSRNLIAMHYPWFLETYDSYDIPVKRHDAVRYFILLHEGGLYLDIGFKNFKNVESLLRGWDFVAAEQDTLEYSVNNAFIASVPGHPFLDFLTERLSEKKNLGVVYATGPNFLTESLLEFGVSLPAIKILDHKYIYPFAWHEKNSNKAQACMKGSDHCQQLYPEAFMFKYFSGSWK